MVDFGGLDSVPMKDLFVVRNFLTANVIHFQAMKTTLANL